MNLILVLFLFINPVNDLNKTSEINALKKEAKTAYTNGNFEEAVLKYEKLVSEYAVQDENVLLNLANAHYKNENAEKAMELYTSLYESKDQSIRSAAYNQSGLLAHQQQKKEEALGLFKEAMKAKSDNEAARFNYTKLKKEIEEEKEQEQQNEDKKDEENKDKKDNKQNQENKEKEDKEKSEKEQEQEKQQGDENKEEQEQQEQEQQEQEGEEQEPPQQSPAEKLKEMNMSEEKAQMILEAMKNNEIQYIQQNKKKPQSRADDGKPDW